MATTQQWIPFIFFLLLLHNTESLPLNQWRTLISLSHSLLSRVATARAARGDRSAAARAGKIAGNINILAGGRLFWSAGWDFARNYAFRGAIPSAETCAIASEMMGLFAEFCGLGSREEKREFLIRKYPRLVDRSKLIFRKLLHFFSRSGVLREVLLVMQKEVVEGGLLKDCLEVGAADLEGLVRVAKEMIFSSSSSSRGEL